MTYTTYTPMQRRELLQSSGIEHLSYSSMKELRNNEYLFLKKYINYEFDNVIWLSTMIGKACHHGIECFYGDFENIELYEKDPLLAIEKITKFAKDYAKKEYIMKNQKPENFWTTKNMIFFGGYEDLRKPVDEYKKTSDLLKTMIDAKTPVDDPDYINIKKSLDDLEGKITQLIEKHKKKDEKLDNFINWGATGSIEKVMEGIMYGMQNWFVLVYPKVKNWTLIGVEYNRTLDITDMSGEVLTLPVKIIIDALFEDENGDLIIVDWKFKGSLSDDTSIKPDYDMQGSTYFFGCMSGMEKMPSRTIFFEIKPSEEKAPYLKQPELRALCEKQGIDWEKGNNGKYMTNDMMTAQLLEAGILQLEPVVYEYVIEFSDKSYLLDMWTELYNQTVKRLFQLLVEDDEFIPNIFDGNFGGGEIAYQEWMKKFVQDGKQDFTDADAVDL